MAIVLFKTNVFFAMFHQSNVLLKILRKDQKANKSRKAYFSMIKREHPLKKSFGASW